MLAGARGSGAGESPAPFDLSPVTLAHEPSFHIGDVEFRPATRELIHDGKASVIEPRVMQLLVALQRANGAVVSKDDLAQLVWEGRIVGEDAINRVVSRLRAVAEKQAGGVFHIKTITKVGYRLVGAAGANTPLDFSTNPRRRIKVMARRDLLIGGSAVTIVSTAGFVWWRVGSRKLPAEARDLLENGRMWMYDGTVDQLSNAIGALRQAAQTAPHSPDVWGSLAYAYMKQSRQAPARDRPELRARANAAIARAFSLESGQADALAAQISGMRLFRNWLAVDRASRAALRRHPHHIGLQLNLADALMQTGRTREGLDAFDDVIGKVPTSARIFNGRCVALWDLGRLEEADAALAKAFALWPRHFGIWFTNVYYRLYNGKPAEASALVADIGNRPLGIPEWNFENIALQADSIASGDRTKIRQAIAASAELARKGTGFAENAAIFAGFAGDFYSAFAILDALYFNRGFTLPDAYFAPEQGMYSGEDRHTYNLFRLPLRALRKDLRFAALTRELGLDAYWAATNSRALVTP